METSSNQGPELHKCDLGLVVWNVHPRSGSVHNPSSLVQDVIDVAQIAVVGRPRWVQDSRGVCRPQQPSDSSAKSDANAPVTPSGRGLSRGPDDHVEAASSR
jgi:hypothetical protein